MAIRSQPAGSGDRIPPHNLEAEASVLGALLLDREAIVKVADFLRALDFYGPAHAIIYSAMLDLYESREPIDIISLTNRLAEKKELEGVGGESAVASLAASVPTAGHVVHYAKIVQKKATLRRLISAAADITDLGFTEDEEVDRVLDEAEQKLFSVSQQHLHQTFVPVKQVLADAFHRIDVLHKGGTAYRGVPSGLKPLDDLLSGFQKADLIILASRPSVGKTSLALDVARHIAVHEKVPVGIFSLEMSKEQLADRFICAEASVDLWKMRTGRLSGEGFPHDDFSKINHAMALLAEAPIFIDDSATNNVLEIRTLARRLHAEHHIGFLVLDYLQLMEGSRSREGRVQEVTEISRALKGLSRELNIPVLAISQLSRAVEGRSPPIPKLSDLRESGCLTGDTLITRADTGERIRIRTLADRDRQEPIPVFSLDEHFRIVIRQLTRAFLSGRKTVYKLQTRSGRSIKASANHPFRVLGGWRRLDELATGDRIALPRISQPAYPVNPIEAWRACVEPAKEAAGIGWRAVQAGLKTAYRGSALFKHGIGRERMERVARLFPETPVLRDLAKSDVMWDEIREIQRVGVEDVFDATVPETHNFVANDIIVHNSIEQDADVVLFLYPRGRHEKASEHQNLVDVIIAKHRNGPVGVVTLFFRAEQASFTALDTRHVAMPEAVSVVAEAR